MQEVGPPDAYINQRLLPADRPEANKVGPPTSRRLA